MAMTTDMGGFRSGFDRLFNDLERSMMGGMGMGMGPSMGTMGTMPMLTSGTTTTGPTRGFMKMDMWEKDNKYFMMMDCAGCSKEDCNITVDEQNNMMTDFRCLHEHVAVHRVSSERAVASSVLAIPYVTLLIAALTLRAAQSSCRYVSTPIGNTTIVT
eukprot:8983-Heterococcus_DN1.PRE.8